jgi:5'-3' exonuclease
MHPALLIDVSCLAYRAFHTTGDLSHEGVRTGVLFGVFRSAMDLMELFATDRVAWCFDRGYVGRSELYPPYKTGRRQMTDEEAEAHQTLRDQLRELHKTWLPRIGFENVFSQKGYEADDVIASACQSNPGRMVIVSSDSDLFQLLSSSVSIWNPIRKREVTSGEFSLEWGVAPSMWADVKALAGCSSDGVEGIRGVGEKTAAKFLNGKLQPGSKAYESIVTHNDVWRRNLPLVRLPFPGINRFEMVEDGEICWEPVLEELGMTSLMGKESRKGRKLA